MTLLLLIWEFFKIGLFSIGGGMATVPFLFDLATARPDWYSTSLLADMIAVSESTPGPIGVNMATYVGNIVCGPFGGFCATVGLVLPSVIIILIIAKVLERFRTSELVKTIFSFLRPIALGLLGYAFWVVFKVAIFNFDVISYKNLIIFLVLFVAIYVLKKKVHPIIWIVIGAVLGILIL